VTGGYRYGFQAQETDAEYFNGAVSFKYRVHDARLGRFLSIDPLRKSFPELTPYQFAGNMVIWAIELEGLEPWITTQEWEYEHSIMFGDFVKTEIQIINDRAVSGEVSKYTCYDCADLAVSLLIRFAAKNGLRVPFTSNRDGSAMNSDDRELRDLDGELFNPDDPEAIQKYEDLIRRKTGASSIRRNELVKIDAMEVIPGDVYSDGFHTMVVVNSEGKRDDRIMKIISGTTNLQGPMNGQLVDYSRSFNVNMPYLPDQSMRWRVIQDARRKPMDKIKPIGPKVIESPDF
jgi:RHS repeat-associated protein